MNRDKVPRSDGFPLAFFQDCWDVIKSDIFGVFFDFHAYSKFVKSLNTSFIALIPETPGATNLADFRPISLVSGIRSLLKFLLIE
jgi:hypothetical protein